jgi:hypothetical protein
MLTRPACAPSSPTLLDAGTPGWERVYEHGDCTYKYPLTVSLSSAGPACGDLADAGLPLGSKAITDLAYDAGACAPSGGGVVETVEPSGPSTFCCLTSA